MEFCPTCANMLLYQKPGPDHLARLACSTCPYICELESKVKIKRNVRLIRKPIDPIFSKDDRMKFNETSEPCPECGHGKTSFTQVQTRSADEPMTLFYTCNECDHTWREN